MNVAVAGELFAMKFFARGFEYELLNRRAAMSLLLVDGYNIINCWSEFSDLRLGNMDIARIELAEMLEEFYCRLSGKKLSFDTCLSDKRKSCFRHLIPERVLK